MDSHTDNQQSQSDEGIVKNMDEKDNHDGGDLSIQITMSPDIPPIGETLAKLSTSLSESMMALVSRTLDVTPLLSLNTNLQLLVSKLYPNSFASSFSSFYRQMIESLHGIFEGFASISESIDKRFSAILLYLINAGFVLSPNSPISLLSDIEELVNNDCASADKVCEVLVNISEMEDHVILKDMIKDWKLRSYFNIRSELLDDALDAHINGKYSLSIPALLPLIEGFFNSCFFEYDHKALIKRMKDFLAETNGRDEMIANSLESVLEEYLFRTATFYGSEDKNSYANFKTNSIMLPEQILNRHGVLHGFDHQYISKENSLRVFFTIDSLVFMMQPRFGSD